MAGPDVWKRGAFAWEYKGKRAYLQQALHQVEQYQADLESPPLLVAADARKIQVHTRFTNTASEVIDIDLLSVDQPVVLQLLRNVFHNPEAFRPKATRDEVTKEAAATVGDLAKVLKNRGEDSQKVAHFLVQCVFCFFAEDIGLLPDKLFQQIHDNAGHSIERYVKAVTSLFEQMRAGGDLFALEIRYFNGRLFESIDPPNLANADLLILQRLARMDWSQIQPEVIGTLFERGLDDSSKAKLGAHYTSADDIMAIIEPVVLWPLRDEFQAAQDRVQKHPKKAAAEIQLLIDRIERLRVLDPACGSGNFLYMALKAVKDLELEIANWAEQFGPRPSLVFSPEQLYGIEINSYAHELAGMVIWLGYLQWMHANGQVFDEEPVLKPLDNIRQMDALLTDDDQIPDWPEADFIIGNPPFIGSKKMRKELGDQYVDRLFKVYDGTVRRESDFVCYWHERARQLVVHNRAQRVGLLATNSIRGGANQETIRKIKETCNLYAAWSDRPWILDGAAVRCSMVMFDRGNEKRRQLDGRRVTTINADLTDEPADLTQAVILRENTGLAFMGDTKGGSFDISVQVAEHLLEQSNPHGRPNSDVVRPWINGKDIVQRPRNMWIIDFGVDMAPSDAARYEAPFEYVKEHIYPIRTENRREAYAKRWWLHVEPRPAMRAALSPLSRFIVTPRVSEHRLFVWVLHPTLPDSATIAFAREDDFFFGILHSRVHELWSRRLRTSLEDRFRYTPTTCFETFPFPTIEPGDPRAREVADAAAELVNLRDTALTGDKKLTLTKLYNKRPTWLANAHSKVDAAVIAAYDWPSSVSDSEILERLLDENKRRSLAERGLGGR